MSYTGLYSVMSKRFGKNLNPETTHCSFPFKKGAQIYTKSRKKAVRKELLLNLFLVFLYLPDNGISSEFNGFFECLTSFFSI